MPEKSRLEEHNYRVSFSTSLGFHSLNDFEVAHTSFGEIRNAQEIPYSGLISVKFNYCVLMVYAARSTEED